MERRESFSWLLTAIAAIVGLVGGWIAYHEKFINKDEAAHNVNTIQQALEAVRDEAKADTIATTTQLKNMQRGRLKSYQDAEKEGHELDPADAKHKMILEYDISNTQEFEKVRGLKTPE